MSRATMAVLRETHLACPFFVPREIFSDGHALGPASCPGCGSFFGRPRQSGTSDDLLCLRVGPRRDRTWRVDLRSGRRGLAHSASGPAGAHAGILLPPRLSDTAGRRFFVTFYERLMNDNDNT